MYTWWDIDKYVKYVFSLKSTSNNQGIPLYLEIKTSLFSDNSPITNHKDSLLSFEDWKQLWLSVQSLVWYATHNQQL